jgi:hypothetical protein
MLCRGTRVASDLCFLTHARECEKGMSERMLRESCLVRFPTEFPHGGLTSISSANFLRIVLVSPSVTFDICALRPRLPAVNRNSAENSV